MQDRAANLIAETSLGDTWGGVLCLFALFLLFFTAVLGYGSLLGRRGSLLTRLSDSFLLGSLALYVSAFALASLHALALFPGWLYGALFFPGLVAAYPLVRDWARAIRGRWCLAGAIFAFVFFLRALSAAQPSQHGDPLLYHLLGPRLWVEGGGFLMHPNLPNALLASTWECLYIWPQLFWISHRPLFGLVEAQLFSQWLHLFLAWGGCSLLVMRIFRGTVREMWLPIAGLAALFVVGVQWTAPLAKNDVGIAFWVLGAVVYFRESLQERCSRKMALSGIFSGLAIAGKITAILSLAPILGLLLLSLWPRKHFTWLIRAKILWLAGFAAGAVPLYTRNYLLSRNPFFPLFPKAFPSPWMSRSWEAHFAQVHPSSPLHSLDRVFSRFSELVKESPWILGAILLLILVTLARKWAKRAFFSLADTERIALISACLCSYVIFVITQAPEIELRYLGASLMVLAAAGACVLLRLSDYLSKEWHRSFAAGAVLMAVMAMSHLPLHILRKIWKEPLGVAYVSTHSGGEAKAWVRQHAEGEFVVVAGDNETYYLTPLGVAVLTERPDFDHVNEQKEFPAFVRELCSLSHARYLLDVRPAIGVEKMFGAAPLAPAKVFSAQGANVYDLRKLDSRCL
ncbi:MAG: hypothetical protein ACXVB9_08825 [Bdellovibrionota bacterium]